MSSSTTTTTTTRKKFVVPSALREALPAVESRRVKVLVIGFGYVGQHLVSALEEDGRFDVASTTHGDMDVTSVESCAARLWSTLPDVLVNTAAVSSPKRCEEEPEVARRTNCPTELLEAAFAVVPDALFIQFSTDIVYGDRFGAPYADGGDRAIEEAMERCEPENVYGSSKLAFEKRLLAWPRTIIFRCSNIIGPPTQSGVGKFAQWLEGELTKSSAEKQQETQKKTAVGLWFDEVRSFVSLTQILRGVVAAIDMFALAHVPAETEARVEALAAAIKPSETAYYERDARKAYPPLFLHLNAGGPEALSRVHVGRLIAEAAGFDALASITAVARPDLPYPSPLDVAMDSSNFEAILGVPLIPIRDALSSSE
mmetsp:Transcript_27879/g.89910  ORF Transcript_27879/g.89910 Transcript_27879/m.89910 type:complete len:370 (+) Transcript_27879:48-1157(+)